MKNSQTDLIADMIGTVEQHEGVFAIKDLLGNVGDVPGDP